MTPQPSPSGGMLAAGMLPEFDQEMATTRKVLERVPTEQFGYKPHEKSMPMGMLASHVAEMVDWGTTTINEPGYDLPPGWRPWQAQDNAELLAAFDRHTAAFRAALTGASDAVLMENWSLTSRGQTFFSMPRIACLRGMILNHIIHHRAQLTVYLRLCDIPVPGVYGPSADEK